MSGGEPDTANEEETIEDLFGNQQSVDADEEELDVGGQIEEAWEAGKANEGEPTDPDGTDADEGAAGAEDPAGPELEGENPDADGDGEGPESAEAEPETAGDRDGEELGAEDQVGEIDDGGGGLDDAAGGSGDLEGASDEQLSGEGEGDVADEVDDGSSSPDVDAVATEIDADSEVGSTGVTDAARSGSELVGVDDGERPADDALGGPPPDVGRLTTGIEALDHHLGGGIPPGRIVSFVATADTQSELLVKQLASQHDCLYLSTLRPKWEVQEEVTDYIQTKGEAGAGRSVQIEQLTADSRLDAARRHIEELDRRSIVVIDSANELESLEDDRYAYFIDEVKRALWDAGSVGLFYCIEEEQPPSGRAVTLRRADLIWRLRQSENVGGIRHELLVSKFRGGRALIEPLTLWLTDEVVMDDGSGAS